jgi:2-hydroxychromene-2-carboxylate isomerase
MSLPARAVGNLITSRALRALGFSLAAARRHLTGAPAVVHYYHQADDPYSHLMLQVLPALMQQHRFTLMLHLVPPPADAAAPDRERLQAWSRRDAASLASLLNLEFSDLPQQPEAETIDLANRCLAQLFNSAAGSRTAVAQALAIGRALWRNDMAALLNFQAVPSGRVTLILAAGEALRKQQGHYLGATLYFEGEWYWGVDRIWYLDQRLRAAGLAWPEASAAIVRLPELEWRTPPATEQTSELHFFCSLRSPYTYLAVARVIELARHYKVQLKLRFVLPMVMRGLPVPLEKRLYIVRDTKREADTLGLRFGDMSDPVGRPTERGLAVLNHAITAGKGAEFLASFMQGVWSEGIDAGTDKGLLKIAARAGLDKAFVEAALEDYSWRAVAEANRDDMLASGLWGVPSFRVNNEAAVWGQDRLCMLERDLIKAVSA